MTDLSWVTNDGISLGQDEDTDRKAEGEFEIVDISDPVDGKQRKKAPRRTIHFASGETIEEYSTDEEEATMRGDPPVDVSKLTWSSYLWFYMCRVATITISVCDYVGGRLACLLGLTTPKYQYAIDEYDRIKEEEDDDEEEAILVEQQDEHGPLHFITMKQLEARAARTRATSQEPKNQNSTSNAALQTYKRNL